MKLKKLGAILLILCACWLVGCYDKVELENRAFVVAVGVDKKEDGIFQVCVTVPDIQSLTGDSSESKQFFVSAEAETIYAAMHKIDAQFSQALYFGQNKAIVFGKSLTEEPQMFKQTMDFFERNTEINRKTIVLITDKTAEEILQSRGESNQLVGLYVRDFYKIDGDRLGVSFKQSLDQMVANLRTNGEAIIPKISIEEKEGLKKEEEKKDQPQGKEQPKETMDGMKKEASFFEEPKKEPEVKELVTIGGASVVKDFVLKGFLDEEEVKYYLLVEKHVNHSKGTFGIITIESNGHHIPMQIFSDQNDLYFEKDGDKLKCTLKLDITGMIEEFMFNDNGLKDPEQKQKIEQQYKEKIEKELIALFEKLQKEFDVDGYDLLEDLRKWHYDLYVAFIEQNNHGLQSIQFIPQVTVEVDSTGTIQ